MRAALLLAASVLALAAADGAAQDAPPAAGAPPRWTLRGVSRIAASRDGRWLAVKSFSDGVKLLPAAGGAPVPLDLGKDERGGHDVAFTADSKWLVVGGEANSMELPGLDKDRTQSVLAFPVDTPAKRKTYRLALKAKALDKSVRKFMDPRFRNVKLLEGEVSGLTAVTGTRVVFHRGGAGAELWDAATGSKAALPPAVNAPYDFSLALSPDGTRTAIVDGDVTRVHDLASGRKIAELPTGHGTAPALDAGGTRLVLALSKDADDDATESETERPRSAHSVACWSVAPAARLWQTPLGTSQGLWPAFVVRGEVAFAVFDRRLLVLDLRDGKEIRHDRSDAEVEECAPTADGAGVWVLSDDTLTRIPLPAPPQK